MSTSFVLFCVFGSIALVAPWVGPWLVQMVGKGFAWMRTTPRLTGGGLPPQGKKQRQRQLELRFTPDFPYYQHTDGSWVIGCGRYYFNSDSKLHRNDGPAVIYSNHKEWWTDGKFQRCERYNDQGELNCGFWPAREFDDGSYEWYRNGQLHRENGPAVHLASGKQEWWLNGKRHRFGGPALDHGTIKEWYTQGEFVRRDTSLNNGVKVEYFNSSGRLHRDNGPALEMPNGDKYWYQNGKQHRENGPAIEYANGNKQWIRNGLTSRLDGPALILADGQKFWYVRGELVGSEVFGYETVYNDKLERLSAVEAEMLIFKGMLPVKLPPLPKKSAVA